MTLSVTSSETVVSSPSQVTAACPRHSPDSGIALSTDSSSFSPQNAVIEKKRSNSLTELSPAGDKIETGEQRPNSASAVLGKAVSSSSAAISTSGLTNGNQQTPFSSSGTVPLNHNPTKAINHFAQPPPFSQLPYNSPYYTTGYTNYNSYGVTPNLPTPGQPAVYPSPYSAYSSSPSAGSHYYPHSGHPSSNLYTANPRYPTYLPQRNSSTSYMSTFSYYPPQTSSSSLPFSDFPTSSAAASTSIAVSTEPPAYVHSSPTKPLSTSQSLPDDEAHMSPDSSVRQGDRFPVVSLPASVGLNVSPQSEAGEKDSDKEESDPSEQEEEGRITRR